MKNGSVVDWVVAILLIVGGLNWGLVGVAHFDVVAAVFGAGSMVSKVVYILVGLAAVYKVYSVVTKK